MPKSVDEEAGLEAQNECAGLQQRRKEQRDPRGGGAWAHEATNKTRNETDYWIDGCTYAYFPDA